MRAMWCESLSPMLRQLTPPSVDLNTPIPAWELRALALSPVPTQTMSLSDGATVTSPMACTPLPSNTGSKVVPLFMVFQTPPERMATYQV